MWEREDLLVHFTFTFSTRCYSHTSSLTALIVKAINEQNRELTLLFHRTSSNGAMHRVYIRDGEEEKQRLCAVDHGPYHTPLTHYKNNGMGMVLIVIRAFEACLSKRDNEKLS